MYPSPGTVVGFARSVVPVPVLWLLLLILSSISTSQGVFWRAWVYLDFEGWTFKLFFFFSLLVGCCCAVCCFSRHCILFYIFLFSRLDFYLSFFTSLFSACRFSLIDCNYKLLLAMCSTRSDYMLGFTCHALDFTNLQMVSLTHHLTMQVRCLDWFDETIVCSLCRSTASGLSRVPRWESIDPTYLQVQNKRFGWL